MPENVRIIGEEYGTPNGAETGEKHTFENLFTAPDLASFVKKPKNATAREYEAKVAALLKAGLIGAINVNDFPDAAALIVHGPGFAAASGQLADSDDKAKAIINMLTAPANPYALFLATALPMIFQLARNHETQLQAAPDAWRTRKERRAARKAEADAKPKVTVHLPFGRTMTLGVRAKFNPGRLFTGMRARTESPESLTVRVFSDQNVINALAKQGVNIRMPPNG